MSKKIRREISDFIISPDGRVLGKMGHSERISDNCCTNVDGIKDQPLFKAGVDYFRL